jgi:SNF family Na+-dependent transporter
MILLFFPGVGYAMVVISGLVSIYYSAIMAYALFYVFSSLTSELPWQHCKEEWKDKFNCVEHVDNFTDYLHNRGSTQSRIM